MTDLISRAQVMELIDKSKSCVCDYKITNHLFVPKGHICDYWIAYEIFRHKISQLPSHSPKESTTSKGQARKGAGHGKRSSAPNRALKEIMKKLKEVNPEMYKLLSKGRRTKHEN